MRRLLAALAALQLAAPAAADGKPRWVGVWQGSVGRSLVRLCIDVWGDGPARGSYYYLSQLEPIALNEEDGEGGWTERAAGSDRTARWDFAEQSGARLRGTWRQGSRGLPFDLRPVAWTAGAWGGPCSSAAFLAPRVGGGSVETASALLGGWRYTVQAYRPAAHFAPEVTIESFAIPAEQPGDVTINAALAARLPKETVDDEFLQCLAGAISAHGYDGDFAESIRPVMAGPAFLVATASADTYCGGAHPNQYYRYATFDRQSGEEVDLFRWLGDSAVERHRGERAADGYHTVRPALRALILDRDPAGGIANVEPTGHGAYPEECREIVRDEQFWTLGLSREGMLFVPVVPHVAAPCAETFTVPWEALAPFLDAEGKAGLARLRAGDGLVRGD